MRIAIFGSRKPDRRWPVHGTQEEFVAAARDIGQQLAHHEHTIVVGSASPNTADAHIVSGFLSIAGTNSKTDARIQVVRPNERDRAFEEEARRAPHVFEFFSHSEGWWQGAHLISLRESDAVLTIGGGKGTYLAGLAAIVAGKRLVPISSFGGASAELMKHLTETGSDERSSKFRRLNGPWTPEARNIAFDLLGAAGGPSLLIIHGRSKDWLDLKDWLREEAEVRNIAVMAQEYGVGATLPEKFERIGREVTAAIALATTDDVGGLAGEADMEKRARQNVWVEVGFIWGRLGRKRLMLLTQPDLEIPSDLQGLEVFQYRDSPREFADQLRTFIKASS